MDNLKPVKKEHPKDEEYFYQSGGIHERSGHIPAWLIAVAVLLLFWSGYYLIKHWEPPSDSAHTPFSSTNP